MAWQKGQSGNPSGRFKLAGTLASPRGFEPRLPP
jgi:hypothetical protein